MGGNIPGDNFLRGDIPLMSLIEGNFPGGISLNQRRYLQIVAFFRSNNAMHALANKIWGGKLTYK